MATMVDETGQRHGRLMVLCRSAVRDPRRGAVWRCQCDCGNEVDVAGIALRQGMVKSCGCLFSEVNYRRVAKCSCGYIGRPKVWSANWHCYRCKPRPVEL